MQATAKSPSGKLLVSQDGPVTTVTLNRPEVHNAGGTERLLRRTPPCLDGYITRVLEPRMISGK